MEQYLCCLPISERAVETLRKDRPVARPQEEIGLSILHARCSKRLSSKAAASEGPEAYPLGRTVRRIRSTKLVRAAEW
jgi:hypothetical protein